jgi:hypothetical protein
VWAGGFIVLLLVGMVMLAVFLLIALILLPFRIAWGVLRFFWDVAMLPFRAFCAGSRSINIKPG